MAHQPPLSHQTDSSNPIPVIGFEEHNEALIALAWARENALLGKLPARLLHVDQHQDLVVPQLSQTIADTPLTVAAVKNLVETEISIASFVWAGVYLGLLDEMFWLAPKPAIAGARPRSVLPSKYLWIATTDAQRREMITMVQRPEARGVGNDDRKSMALHFVDTETQIPEQPGPEAAPWVLGIDLDYFSCNSMPDNGFRISVTQETYEQVSTNRHHPLRLSPSHRIEARHDEQGYWLEYDMLPPRSADPLVRSTAEIEAEVDRLAAMLSRQAQAPALILIARSQISGFTPRHQCEFIEARVKDMLASVYSCTILEGSDLW
ncbi:UPF0489 family protein [Pseudophaeobacter arcticus]|uniref:UPF0489 family protein n=1 Tax=Pseudophaeobacter arcticus TaxID=385492 RepID=UPI00249065BF|nr:UPF0489 family protein [Pseudophaeobacter arcticus]